MRVQLVRVDVYLLQRAIDEDYELKIANYNSYGKVRVTKNNMRLG
jgi:hypothetical protein